MLSVVNDPAAAPARRDRMAIAAAPYCHARVADKGVRAQQAETAKKAGGSDTEWADDLRPDGWPLSQ
jgi:phage terminase small subunit